MPSVKIFIASVAPVVPWVMLELWLALNVDYSSLLDTSEPFEAPVRMAVALENFLLRYINGVFLLASFNPLVELGIIGWSGGFRRKVAELSDLNRETRYIALWLLVSAASGILGISAVLTKIGPWPSVHNLGLWGATVAYSLCLASVYLVEKHRILCRHSNWSPGWVLAAGLLLPLYSPILLAVIPLLTLARGLRRRVATVGT